MLTEHGSGEESGEPRTRKPAGRPPKAPDHCEVRWSSRAGCWLYRAVLHVGPDRRWRSKWISRDAAKTEAADMVERRRNVGSGDGVTLKDACQDVLDTVRTRDGTWRSYDEHFQTL